MAVASNIPTGFQLPALISIFAEIAGVSADPQTLMARASCIYSCVPAGMQMGILIDLAQQILAGGANSCLLHGVGAPVAVPPCIVAIYIEDPPSGLPNPGVWVWIQQFAQWYNTLAAGP